MKGARRAGNRAKPTRARCSFPRLRLLSLFRKSLPRHPHQRITPWRKIPATVLEGLIAKTKFASSMNTVAIFAVGHDETGMMLPSSVPASSRKRLWLGAPLRLQELL